jgi:hypothetical protein
MLYVNKRNLVDKLENSGYHLDKDLQLELRGNLWQFRPNQENGKLAVTSFDRNDKKKIIIGTPIFDYESQSSRIEDQLQMLEDDLFIAKPDAKNKIYSFGAGAITGYLIGQNLFFSLVGGVAVTAITRNGSSKIALRNINDYVETVYHGKTGKFALDYLGIK